MPTAGIVVIGNEILSGKVVDTNSPYLCRELRALGVDVERIVTIPDGIEVIAENVKAMSQAFDFVFTSMPSGMVTMRSTSTPSARSSRHR